MSLMEILSQRFPVGTEENHEHIKQDSVCSGQDWNRKPKGIRVWSASAKQTCSLYRACNVTVYQYTMLIGRVTLNRTSVGELVTYGVHQKWKECHFVHSVVKVRIRFLV
jgi:hypothetical protein